MREVSDRKAISKSLPEHDEMRRLVALLRGMEPEATRYDDAYTGLMRYVMHHLATEETMILPEAERLIQDPLGALGNKMIIRRMKLIGLAHQRHGFKHGLRHARAVDGVDCRRHPFQVFFGAVAGCGAVHETHKKMARKGAKGFQ